MSLFSRRCALLAAGTAAAVVASLALPASYAAAADPLTGKAGPTLAAPGGDEHYVTLSWTPATATLPYATGYQLQISPNGDWTNDTVTLPNGGVTTNTSYEVPISLPHGYYYWRVRAVDAAANSNWSSVGTLLHEWNDPMTLLKSPTTDDPEIAWSPVTGASLYRVRFSTENSFPNDAAKTAVCWTANTTFRPYVLQTKSEKTGGDCMKATDFKTNVALYWEVRAFDDSTAAPLVADTVNDPGYECATAQPECDADFLSSGLSTFTWSNPAAGTVTPGVVTGLTTSWHSDTLPGNDCDNSDDSYCPMTPTFSWDPVLGANYYRVAVFRDPNLSNIYRVYDTEWPSVTPRDAFLDAQAGNGFYWTVQAGTCTNSDTDLTCGTPVITGKSDPSGGTSTGTTTPQIIFSSFSDGPATFDKRTADASNGAPQSLTYPTDGASCGRAGCLPAPTTGRTGYFQWTSFFDNGGRNGYDVRNYRVQIATDADFSNVVLDVPTIDDTQYTPQAGDLPNGTYYWRVQGIDESGNPLSWSDVRHFTRDATPPVFTLTDTSNLPVTGTTFHVKVSEPVNGNPIGKLHIVPVVGGGAELAGTWSLQPDGVSWALKSTTKLVPGQSYAVALDGGITDLAGNAARVATHTARATVFADDKSAAWSYSSGAVRHTASGAIGGTHVVLPSGKAGSVHLVGSKVLVYGCKSPTYAKLVIAVDGKTLATVSEHQSFTKCGVLLYSGSLTTSAVHTLRVTASGGYASIDEARTA